jgi:hypothetical protein
LDAAERSFVPQLIWMTFPATALFASLVSLILAV